MKTSKFIISLSLLAFAACTPKNQFAISGSVEGDCDSVYFTGDHSDLIEAAVPVVDGSYQWTGTVDSVINIWVCRDRQHSQLCCAILEPGNIKLDIPVEDLAKALPSGTPLNDSIVAYVQAEAHLYDRLDPIYEKMADASGEELEALKTQHGTIYDEYLRELVGKLSRNSDNAFGVYMLPSLQHFGKPELVEEPVKKLRERFPGNFWTEFIADLIEGKMRAAVGRKYTDLAMSTPEGAEMKLSDVIPNNKYTFIDFWASWCGPCRAELPNVKAAYDKYHAEGFEVVGVSFDANEAKWKNAIAEEGLSWFHMSDLKGWDCAAADVYGIRGIPFTMLVAQDGTIVANNLRGDALMEKLDELMGK